MTEPDYIALQHQYGGMFVARRGAEVLFSAPTYDDLHDWLLADSHWMEDVIVDYVEPIDCIRVY